MSLALTAGDINYLLACIIGIVIFLVVAYLIPWEDEQKPKNCKCQDNQSDNVQE